MKYIGLDVHSTHINCAVIDEQGNLIHHNCFPTSLQNLINLSEKLKHPLSLVFEEGELADWLCQGLHPHFEKITVADPMENRLIYASDYKSDTIDPLKLATLLRGGFIHPVHHTWDHHRSQFKQMVFAYHDMAKQVTRIKNKIKAYYRNRGLSLKPALFIILTNGHFLSRKAVIPKSSKSITNSWICFNRRRTGLKKT